jgi:hypothetical protein
MAKKKSKKASAKKQRSRRRASIDRTYFSTFSNWVTDWDKPPRPTKRRKK